MPALFGREEMLGSLPKLQGSVEAYLKCEKDLLETQAEQINIQQQQQYIEEALHDHQHDAYTLHDR